MRLVRLLDQRDILDCQLDRQRLDRVVEVRDHEFSGHVYDLQSVSGWMVAQGIICSNCRCVSEPVVDEGKALVRILPGALAKFFPSRHLTNGVGGK